MPSDKKSWWATYCTAFEKCQSADDAGRSYIHVRPYDGGYTLVAYRSSIGPNRVALGTLGISDWAARVADKVHELGCCQEPTETDEHYRQ